MTLGDLIAAPTRLGELGEQDVLIAASGTGEALVHESTRKREATIVFMHETIQMMKADRASELAKLADLVSQTSAVVPLRKKPASFWDHITIGRSSSSDIVIDDPAISAVHANFVEAHGKQGMTLLDVGSSNGTFLNRLPLQPHVPVSLSSGDCVRFGQTVFYYVSQASLRDLVAFRAGR